MLKVFLDNLKESGIKLIQMTNEFIDALMDDRKPNAREDCSNNKKDETRRRV